MLLVHLELDSVDLIEVVGSQVLNYFSGHRIKLRLVAVLSELGVASVHEIVGQLRSQEPSLLVVLVSSLQTHQLLNLLSLDLSGDNAVEVAHSAHGRLQNRDVGRNPRDHGPEDLGLNELLVDRHLVLLHLLLVVDDALEHHLLVLGEQPSVVLDLLQELVEVGVRSREPARAERLDELLDLRLQLQRVQVLERLGVFEVEVSEVELLVDVAQDLALDLAH